MDWEEIEKYTLPHNCHFITLKLNVNKVLDASGLKILHASRSTSNNKHGATIQVLKCRDSVLSILIVRRADHYDIGLSLERRINTLFYGLEAEVVNHLITGTSQEVARELCTGLTHGQIADGQHKGCRNLGLFGMDAEILKVGLPAEKS